MEKRSIIFSVLLLVTTLVVGSTDSYAEAQETQFLFVHGTSHGAWCWYEVVTLLQERGYKATALDMISDGRDKTNANTVTSLAQYTKPLTDFLANVVGQVVLVGHSLGGGVTISYAMEQYPKKISKAIFLAALMPLNNQSGLVSAPADVLPNILAEQAFIINYANGPSAPPTSLSPNLASIAAVLYNQSPAKDVTLSLSLLDAEPYVSIAEVLSLTPSRYGSIRRFFFETDQDHVFSISDFQYILKQNPPEQVFFIPGKLLSQMIMQLQSSDWLRVWPDVDMHWVVSRVILSETRIDPGCELTGPYIQHYAS